MQLFPRDGIHLWAHGSFYRVVFGLSELGTRDRSVAGEPAKITYLGDRRPDVAVTTVGPPRPMHWWRVPR
jgi:hypothetical protein